MVTIIFPFKVKLNGAYYNAGELIKVEDAAEYVKQGAIIVATEPKQTMTMLNETFQPVPGRRGRRRA